MNLQPETIAQVQTTWKAVEPIAPVAAQLFYDNLFTADPSLRSMFRGDMEEQGRKLMDMIGVAIRKLDNPRALTHVLEALGKRHHGYGVRDEHYAIVGEALLATLAAGLGDLFTPPVEQAWATVYGVIADVMQRAAHAESEALAALMEG